MKQRGIRTHLHNTFIAHEGNGYRPAIFSVGGLVGVAVIVLVIASFPVVRTQLSYHALHLAAVVPTVVFVETNTVRETKGQVPVVYSNLLAQAAQAKAEDMMLRQYFAHTSPEGLSPWYWLDTVGYAYTYAGENLAAHFTESSDVVRAWVASPTHYENLIKPEFTEMGVGIVHGTFEGKETTLVVQLFGTPVRDVVPIVHTPPVRDIPLVAKAPVEPVSAPAPQTVSPETVVVTEQGTESANEPRVLAEVSEALPLTTVSEEVTKMSLNAPTQTVAVSEIRHSPTLLEVLYDRAFEISVLLLLVLCLAFSLIYVWHHAYHGVHMPHIARGTGVALASIVVAFGILALSHNSVLVPSETQQASVIGIVNSQ